MSYETAVGDKVAAPTLGGRVAKGLHGHCKMRGDVHAGGVGRHGTPRGVEMTDDDWAALQPGERDFAVRWLGLSEGERDDFCRQLLAAIEVLQRFRVLDGEAEGSAAT